MNLRSRLVTTTVGIIFAISPVSLMSQASTAQTVKPDNNEPITITPINGTAPRTQSSPGTPGPDGSVPTTETFKKLEQSIDLPNSDVVPTAKGANGSTQGRASSTYCRQSACITLFYSGNRVYFWRTTAYSPRYRCTFANYRVNGRLVASGRTVCGNAFVSTLNTNFAARGNTFCSNWAGIPGVPCLRFN